MLLLSDGPMRFSAVRGQLGRVAPRVEYALTGLPGQPRTRRAWPRPDGQILAAARDSIELWPGS